MLRRQRMLRTVRHSGTPPTICLVAWTRLSSGTKRHAGLLDVPDTTPTDDRDHNDDRGRERRDSTGARTQFRSDGPVCPTWCEELPAGRDANQVGVVHPHLDNGARPRVARDGDTRADIDGRKAIEPPAVSWPR